MARFDPFDPYRAGMGDDDTERAKRLDSENQVDPALAEGRASSSSKITLFAIGIALVLAAVFYGLNNTSVHEASTNPPAQTAQTQTKPANPNTQPGMTTGAAPSRPAAPQPAPAVSPNAPK